MSPLLVQFILIRKHKIGLLRFSSMKRVISIKKTTFRNSTYITTEFLYTAWTKR